MRGHWGRSPEGGMVQLRKGILSYDTRGATLVPRSCTGWSVASYLARARAHTHTHKHISC